MVLGTAPRRPLRSLVAFAIVAASLAVAAPRLAVAHGGPSPESLTQTLVALNASYRSAAPAEQARLASALLTTAAARHQLLLSLMESDPGEVLRVALSGAARAGLPPAVRAHVEEEVEVEGVLEILHEDWSTGSRYRFLLDAGGERLTLHFATDPPGHLLTGARVRVRGVRLDATLALGGSNGSDGVQTLSSALPNALGERRTLVMLVNFSDAPTEPYTAEYARSVMFDTTSRFYLENSSEQTWLAGDVVGWFTTSLSSTACDTGGIAAQAQAAAAAAGVNLAAYGHYVYAFPQNYACYFWGRSTVGGSPSEAWINGDFELGVTAHEFGHGLGLWHSHSLDCGAATLASSCTAYEYGDTLDMMGASSFAHFNAFQKERLGWLNSATSPPITTVQTDGTYTLDAYELAGPGPKALKILKSTDPSTGLRTWYYVQSRQAIGFDGSLADNTNVLNGLLIHFGTESNGNSSYLLDMTPESGTSIYLDWRDPALVVGRDFHDPEAGMTLTTEWVTPTEAAVTVRFETAVTVSTDQPSYTRSQAVSVRATVRSGSSPVANAAVIFTVTKSSGAVVTGTATTGSNGIATYKLRLRRDDPVGTYQARGVATKGAQSGSAATTFTVR
jgi:hypothetical protein